MSEKGHIGSDFHSFLKDQGTFEETQAIAIKRTLAWQLEQAMTAKKMSKNQMAKAMKTSRSQLDRILDPNNHKIQVDTLANAARVLGHKLRIELV